MADIYITQEVAKMIGDRRKVYTRNMPQPVLCITGTPLKPVPCWVYHDEIWYFCPHCPAYQPIKKMLPTLMDEIKLCPKCYGPIMVKEK